MNDDEKWMREALQEARQCLRPQPLAPAATLSNPSFANNPAPNLGLTRQSDVPVGALCVLGGAIVGRGHNRREIERDPTAHAEVLALRAAAQQLGDWRLENVTLYVTLEPCVMCAGAIWLARVGRVVFGAWDERAGACGSLFDVARDPRLNHRPQLRGGVLAEECAALLREFFSSRRT